MHEWELPLQHSTAVVVAIGGDAGDAVQAIRRVHDGDSISELFR